MENLDPGRREAYEYIYTGRSGRTLSVEAWRYLLTNQNVMRVTPQLVRENAHPDVLRELENRDLLIPTLEVEIPEGATILGISQDGTVSYILPHDNSN